MVIINETVAVVLWFSDEDSVLEVEAKLDFSCKKEDLPCTETEWLAVLEAVSANVASESL